MWKLLLNYPRYGLYWLSCLASETGDWVRNMALTYLVLRLSGGSGVAMSVNLICEYAPIFLFGSFVGVFADRWNRRRTLLVANIFRATMVITFFLAVQMQWLWLVFIGAFLSAVGTLFFRAPASAFTMQLVPEGERKAAASLRQMAMSGTLLLGPPLGTALYATLESQGALLVSVGCLLLSSLLLACIREPGQQQAASRTQRRLGSVWADMREGARYARTHAMLRTLLLVNAVFGLGGGLISVMTIFVLTEFLQLPETAMGGYISLQGFGMLASAIMLGRWKLPGKSMTAWGMVGMGFGLGGTILVPHLAVSAVFLLIFSFSQTALNIGYATLMQTNVEYEYQGRAGMMVQTVFMGAMLLSALLAGWLHEGVSVRILVGSGGILVLAGGLLAAYRLRENSQQTTRASTLDGQG